MADWFRSWHGAPSDAKWRTVAKRAKVQTSLVVAIVWTLLDRASQSDDRGSAAGFDPETIADYLDCDTAEVDRVVAAMREKCVLTEMRFASWDKRQAKREREDDNSAARVETHRLRNKIKELEAALHNHASDVTPCNATQRHETPRVEESRVEKDNSELRSGEASPSPMDEDPKKVLFGEALCWLAKESKRSEAATRAAVGQMLKLAGGDAHSGVVLGIIRDAKRERKADPVAWIMAMLGERKSELAAARAPPIQPEKRNPAFAALEKLKAARNGNADLESGTSSTAVDARRSAPIIDLAAERRG